RTWANLSEAQRLLPNRGSLRDIYWIVKGARVGVLTIVAFSAFADLWQSVILFWLIGLGVTLRRYAEDRYLVTT
ncbi:MAG TPA: hypothetical protein VL403_08010, partial [Candidatus Kryptonia bacterium]|nr:hypothetical protein [Candidatus Kryptonia bacterium]